MACQTCDHTVRLIANSIPKTWWCPRCGTIKTEHRSEAPFLVGICKDITTVADAARDELTAIAKAEGREPATAPKK